MDASKLSKNMSAVLNNELDDLDDDLDDLDIELEDIDVELDNNTEDDLNYTDVTWSNKYFSELHDYLRDIEQFEFLTAEEEIELAKLIQAGNEAKANITESNSATLTPIINAGLQAREKFINSNYKLVISIAKRYFRRVNASMSLLDIIQAGNLGLMKAVDRFDYTRGLKFSTFATWWIRQHINRDLLNESHTIRLPIHMHELLGKIYRLKITQPNISNTEIAEQLNLSPEKVARLLHIQDTMSVASLDKMVDATEDMLTPLLDMIASDVLPPDILHNINERDRLLNDILFSKLTDREHYVIARRYGLMTDQSATLEAIGAELGVTRERVRQIESKALNKLRAPRVKAELKDLVGLK